MKNTSLVIKNLLKKFDFKNKDIFKESPFYKILNENNSVSICLRQNRFNEGKNKDNSENKIKSNKFSDEQIEYINDSINYFKKKISNPFFVYGLMILKILI